MRHGFYASTSSTINALQVMSYGLELELERTVVNALTKDKLGMNLASRANDDGVNPIIE